MSNNQKHKSLCLPFTYRIYASETVVYDGKGRRVVGCPTEQEAVEVIAGITKEIERRGEMFEVRRMENWSEDSETSKR